MKIWPSVENYKRLKSLKFEIGWFVQLYLIHELLIFWPVLASASVPANVPANKQDLLFLFVFYLL